MDINNLIKETIKNMDLETIIKDKTEKVIKETIEETISSNFRSYSDFGKELKEKMTKELRINLDEIKFNEYNQVIIDLLKQTLKENSENNLYLKDKVELLIKELTQTEIKHEYKLSEIVELYKQEFNEDAQEDEIEEMYLKVENDSRFWTRIYLNKKEVSFDYEAEVQFSINNETAKIEHLNLEGDIIKGKSIYKNRIFGVDKLLYQIYLVGAKIIIDEKNCDLYYEYED